MRKTLIAFALVIVAAAAGLWWFFGGEAPAEVDLTQTASAVSEDSASLAETSEDTSTTEAANSGIDGTWVVDTSVGEFTVTDETTASFAGFRVEEVLESIGSATAVGRTPVLDGNIEIEDATLVSAEVTVDLTAIESDQARREDAIQRALGTSTNPEARFVLTEPIDLGAGAESGETVEVNAVGELTINGVTNTVEIQLQAQLVDDMILVTGSTPVVFADYGVTAPTAPVVVSVEDNGILELQLWLSR